ncbi:MAG: hypothetical protein IE914_10960 [Thiotrichales bacterium]|nr:hypothetical protein [Thiotrichales bacterium]
MKLTKLSLVAALAVSAAFAGDATISGDAKVFYGTSDAGTADLFDKAGAYGDASVNLDYSREVVDGLTLNAGVTGLSTLGLENTAVSGVWANGEGATTLEDTFWFDVANLTATFGNTTAIIGRQKLDTPLAFTETWNVVENTFDAFVFANSDLQDTTLVAAAVTRANFGNASAPFTNFQGGMVDLGDGIYAVGAVTKLIPMTTAQVWYYEANGLLDVKKVWVQADVDAGNGVGVGLQYGGASSDSSIVAGQLSYAVDALSTSVAYSQADKKGAYDFANFGGFGGSSVYTEAWWNFGKTTVADAKALTLKAGYDLGAAQLAAQYTNVKNDSTDLAGVNVGEMDEVTLTATTKVGPFDATLAYINGQSDDAAVDGNTVQVYLTAPFSL